MSLLHVNHAVFWRKGLLTVFTGKHTKDSRGGGLKDHDGGGTTHLTVRRGSLIYFMVTTFAKVDCFLSAIRIAIIATILFTVKAGIDEGLLASFVVASLRETVYKI